MASSLLKSYLPRSLFARGTLIVVIPLIGLQLVVGTVFVQRHFEDVTRQMTRTIAREIAVAQQVIRTSPTAEIAQLRLSNLAVPLGMRLNLDPPDTPLGETRRQFFDLSGRALVDELLLLLGPGLRVDLTSNTRLVDTRIPTDKGVLHAVIPRTRVTVSNPHQLLVLMVITALVLALIAILFLRHQLRPINELADAADAFGKGRSLSFRPAGADEVRRAGGAFLAMRARIERAMDQRTMMLSGVSHDLRTPLTRMKLTLALTDPTEDVTQMNRDVVEMEKMLDAFLAFARSDQGEEAVATDLPALATDLAEQARRGGCDVELKLDVDADVSTSMPLRPSAIRRALNNLLSNADRYGERVLFTLRVTARSVQFIVEDDGPGVPADKRDEVTRAFTRLDTARNQDKGGGVGLGLTIALDTARAHGGALELSQSEDLGGLKCVIRLPR